MRILFLVHQFMPDFAAGTERVALNLAKAAQASGHAAEVFTVTHRGGEAWRKDGDGFLTAMVDGVRVTAIPGQERPLVDLGFQPNETLAGAMSRFLEARPAFDLAHVVHHLRLTEAVEVLVRERVPYVVTLTDFFTVCYRVSPVRLDGTLCAGPEGGEACRVHCRIPDLADTVYGARIARYKAILERASAVVAVSHWLAAGIRAEHPDLTVPRPRAR